jgi:hypothetical protein
MTIIATASESPKSHTYVDEVVAILGQRKSTEELRTSEEALYILRR